MRTKPGNLCFVVSLNGKRLCVAGVDAGVLHAVISWVGGSPRTTRKGGRSKAGATDLHVSGLYSPDPETQIHPLWAHRRLRDGDAITLRLVRGAKPDRPHRRTVTTAAGMRENERQYYLRMKKKFERKRS